MGDWRRRAVLQHSNINDLARQLGGVPLRPLRNAAGYALRSTFVLLALYLTILCQVARLPPYHPWLLGPLARSPLRDRPARKHSPEQYVN